MNLLEKRRLSDRKRGSGVTPHGLLPRVQQKAPTKRYDLLLKAGVEPKDLEAEKSPTFKLLRRFSSSYNKKPLTEKRKPYGEGSISIQSNY
jgi:hypothetical protein